MVVLQVWMRAHPPQQKASFLGSSPKVHSGFYKAWTANHLHTEIMAFLQVRAVLQHPTAESCKECCLGCFVTTFV